jgi:hypothetical protein
MQEHFADHAYGDEFDPARMPSLYC